MANFLHTYQLLSFCSIMIIIFAHIKFSRTKDTAKKVTNCAKISTFTVTNGRSLEVRMTGEWTSMVSKKQI